MEKRNTEENRIEKILKFYEVYGSVSLFGLGAIEGYNMAGFGEGAIDIAEAFIYSGIFGGIGAGIHAEYTCRKKGTNLLNYIKRKLKKEEISNSEDEAIKDSAIVGGLECTETGLLMYPIGYVIGALLRLLKS